MFLDFHIYDGKSSVNVKSKILQTGEIIDITGDLLIAPDGFNSSIRQCFLPNLKLRYSGNCAWRGVLNFFDKENSGTVLRLKKAFPDFRKCLYFDLGLGTHSVL